MFRPATPAPPTAASQILLTNTVGLHARPAVKLTRLAKRFTAAVALRVGETGAWVDAKSIVKVMALKAPEGSVLHLRAEGEDGERAVAALVELVRGGFADDLG